MGICLCPGRAILGLGFVEMMLGNSPPRCRQAELVGGCTGKLGSIPRVSELVGPGLGLDNGISNKFPGDIDAAYPVGWPASGFAKDSGRFPGLGDFQG